MSLRSNGSYIGPRPTGPTNGIAGVASGVWDLRSAQRQRSAGAWPFPFSSPTQITGLQLWLDASDASTLYDATTGGSLVVADGAVARWEDKSGNSRHATQGTAGARPLRKTSVQVGRDVLRFDGSDDSLSIPNSTSMFTFLHHTAGTVFVAFKPSQSADPNDLYRVIDTRGGQSVGYILYFDDRFANSRNDLVISQSRVGGVGVDAVLNALPDDSVPATSFVVITDKLDLSLSASLRSSLYVNGAAPVQNNTATNAGTSANASAEMTLSVAGFDGDIAEIIIYDTALSDTDREEVENYLMAKWGIT